MTERMKVDPDSTDEVHDPLTHRDPHRCKVTVVAQFPPHVAQTIVETLAGTVQTAHATESANKPDEQGIIRAQTFEEGEVYMLASPFDGYFADRYLMDFYDAVDRDICSRMHLHTGLRFVRMMTGVDTIIRVSSFAPFDITEVEGVTPFRPHTFVDHIDDERPGVAAHVRHNLVVPACSWVDMQVPRGTSHQFNALGPNAVIDSVHPEESIETLREQMSGYTMTAQTIFLAKERPAAETCAIV